MLPAALVSIRNISLVEMLAARAEKIAFDINALSSVAKKWA